MTRATPALLVFIATTAVAQTEFVRLDVPLHGDAIVATPGHDGPASLVIALHGNYDRAEWLCDVFAEMTAGSAWVLCPRGVPRSDSPPGSPRWTFGSASAVKAEIEAGVLALRARYGTRVASGPPLLSGYSAGAFLAAVIAAGAPAAYPRVLLAEGGHDPWTPGRLTRFARGGQAVAYGCGTGTCVARSRRVCRELDRRGLPCRVHEVAGMGHSYTRAFGTGMRAAHAWLQSPLE